MGSEIIHERLKIEGMTCAVCQEKIEKRLGRTAGVQSVKVDYPAGHADIYYANDKVTREDIIRIIEKMNYKVVSSDRNKNAGVIRTIGICLSVILIYVIMQQFGILNLLVPGQLADTKMGYGMLFVIGLLTSVHCIAMCGGINLFQCMPNKMEKDKNKSKFQEFKPVFFYNSGRVISYTAIGFVLGAIGFLLGGGSYSAVPVLIQGLLKIVAGAFMVIMGINMLGIFPAVRKLQPYLPRLLYGKVGKRASVIKNPFVIGLLNGLMPCGPMQSMQIVALATGNPFSGALSMLMFSLGTVPLMMGLGSIVTVLGKKFAARVMMAGAILVAALGLAMLSQGVNLSGMLQADFLLPIIIGLCVLGIISEISFQKKEHKDILIFVLIGAVIAVWIFPGINVGRDTNITNSGNVKIVDGRQLINSKLSPGSYPDITVEAGTPVKWIITAPNGSINGCNNTMNIQAFGVKKYSFKSGENVIEFTPEKTGKYQYYCWMGMIRGTITVVDEK